MHQDEELHDELLKLFRQYFQANQEWLSKGTKRSAIRIRQIMSDIRRVCSERRVVVREWMDHKEIELLERNLQRKGQNQSGRKDSSAN
jgi:uncharacterized protein YggL (DUF469 family)